MSTPRVARFEDLRVGQWVAWCDGDQQFGGYVKAVHEHAREADISQDADDRTALGVVTLDACERDLVTILRDAPAPPVTVRRDDYDALAAAVHDTGPWAGRTFDAARALIDNADTEATP
jgi:hypothetical protein